MRLEQVDDKEIRAITESREELELFKEWIARYGAYKGLITMSLGINRAIIPDPQPGAFHLICTPGKEEGWFGIAFEQQPLSDEA